MQKTSFSSFPANETNRHTKKGLKVLEEAFYLGCVDDFSQRPHQRSVDPHQLLGADLIRLVQHHAHLVLVVLQGSDHLGELVGDVQLVGVEQEDDAVHALGEPLQHRGEVVTWGEEKWFI